MSEPDQELLEELIGIVEHGKPASTHGHWKSHLDEGLTGWIKGKPGSMNRVRLTNAIRAQAAPRDAALWWTKLLEREEKGVAEDDRIFYFNTYEPLSGIYWGWSLLGEATAHHLLSQEEHPDCKKATEVLRRSVRRHIGMAALCAVSDLEIRHDGELEYRGPAVLSPGARTKGAVKANGRTINQVFAFAIDMPPKKWKGKDNEGKLAKALPKTAWGLSETDRQKIHDFISPGPPDRDAASYIVENLLPETRTVCPFQFRRYEDRVIGMMMVNPNGNSGATYYAEVPNAPGADGEDVRYLYPYGEDAGRIRGKNKIGAGSGKFERRGEREFFVCDNFTEEELRRKGGNRQRFEVEAELPPRDAPKLVFKVGQKEPLTLLGG